MQRRTVFSDCRLYRYCLWRQWNDLLSPGPVRYVQFIGLNPSTADEIDNDPTIRRCIDYSKRWGYDALVMTNLFAWRDTEPADMMKAPDPIGPDNDYWLTEIASGAGVIVAAWGNDGAFKNRHKDVLKLIPNLQCLKITKTGQPWHPLYLKATLTPFPYVAR